MAIETQIYYFAAPPKAGCRYVHQALKELAPVDNGSLHTLPGERDKPLLSIVRDPCNWLRSYFQNINKPIGMPAVDAFLAYSRGEAEPSVGGFVTFARLYIAAGLSIGAMFAAYAADHVWRIEDCPGVLEGFFNHTFGSLDKKQTPHPLIVPDEVRRAIYAHERKFCTTWGYA